MKPYLLTELPTNVYNAGFKAKDDIRNALGDTVIPLTIREYTGWRKLPALLQLLNRLNRIPRGGMLYIQCPAFSFFSRKLMPIVCRLLRRRELQVVLIIHDVNSLRRPDRASEMFASEMELYSLAQCLIVHNDRMKAALQESHGIPADKMVTLDIFDYLCEEPAPEAGAEEAFTRTVFVAGNLDPVKSAYIYRLGDLSDTLTINLYGGSFDRESAADTLHYQGSFPPDELPQHLKGNFGLIWDGETVESCTGQIGEYLRINNPHKTSLYLAAGFPVIIWSQAALAPFITENGLGLAVDSLAELPAVFDGLTTEEYARMRENVRRVGTGLRTGEQIRRAVQKAESR